MPTKAMQARLPDNLRTEAVLDLIFRDPEVKHGLSEFDDLGKKPHEILKIYPKTIGSGRAKGEVRYYLKCLKRLPTCCQHQPRRGADPS